EKNGKETNSRRNGQSKESSSITDIPCQKIDHIKGRSLRKRGMYGKKEGSPQFVRFRITSENNIDDGQKRRIGGRLVKSRE
ncbi:hypothetical protein NPIL_382471, partial [Nephila pilipes]